MTDIKKISTKDFREQGYLQELNRQFLHPLGLALEVKVDAAGEEHFGEVWDYRDDPEGMIYGPGMIDATKTDRIRHEQHEKANSRRQLLGYYIQPETEVKVDPS